MATKRGEEEEAERVETVGETATEEEEEEEENSSSGGDFEIRAVPRTEAAAAAPSVSDDAQSVSDDATDAERTANKCVFCSGRKVKGASFAVVLWSTVWGDG
jgi:hypothetical protein